MTVISKNISDKKSDNLKEPLVENIVVEHSDKDKKLDVEAGGYPIPIPQTTRYIISARVRPYYSLMFILMLVLLVATSLLGIFGTEYLYEQYRSLVGVEQKPTVYRAWGTLSLDGDPAAMAYENKFSARFEKSEPSETDGSQSILSPSNFYNEDEKNMLPEQFELDLAKDHYEKINVPSKGISSRFVHDFYSNYTAIIDVENRICFVMPLDRNITLPPSSLYDLLFKISDRYYAMDTEKIHRDMKAIEPPITDLDFLGVYIKKECKEFTTYMLEKLVNGVIAD